MLNFVFSMHQGRLFSSSFFFPLETDQRLRTGESWGYIWATILSRQLAIVWRLVRRSESFWWIVARDRGRSPGAGMTATGPRAGLQLRFHVRRWAKRHRTTPGALPRTTVWSSAKQTGEHACAPRLHGASALPTAVLSVQGCFLHPHAAGCWRWSCLWFVATIPWHKL